MSKGPWRRDPKTGLPFNQVDDQYSCLDDGSFDLAQFPHCDVFHVNTVTWLAAGLEPGQKPNVTRVRDRMIPDPRFPGATIFDDNGKVIAMPTNQATAVAWGKLDRQDRRANQKAGKKL